MYFRYYYRYSVNGIVVIPQTDYSVAVIVNGINADNIANKNQIRHAASSSTVSILEVLLEMAATFRSQLLETRTIRARMQSQMTDPYVMDERYMHI